ncbi:MAG: S8 family serine peptidase, partial [Calditrichota bacterium]
SSSNNDRSNNFPSNYESESVLAVAASDHRDQLSSFSSYGLTTVDLAAPGTNILSTTPSNNYQSFSGTSMATPYVSGVAALCMAQFPGISMTELKYRLMGSSDAKNAFTNITVTGGRLNALKALGTNPMIVVEPRGNTTEVNSPYTVNAFATDDGPISTVTLEYTLSGTNTGGDVVQMTGNGKYTATIPAQPLNTTITYFAKATDASGAVVQSLTRSFKVSLDDDGGGGGGGGIPCGCGAFAFSVNTGDKSFDATATLLANVLLVGLVLMFFMRRRRK